MPQPTAAPLTAAMIGLSHSRAAMAAGVALKVTGIGARDTGLGPAMISPTSSPEQKAGSAPVRIMQRTSGSAAAVRRLCSSSSYAG